MTIKKLFLSAISVMFVLFMVSCSTGDDNSSNPVNPSMVITKENASKVFNARVKSSLNYVAPLDTNVIPSVLIIEGSSIADMPDDGIKQIVRTVQAGNTVILLNITYDDIACLGIAFGIIMDKEEEFANEVLASKNSFYETIQSIYCQVNPAVEDFKNATEGNPYNTPAFELIGIRNKDLLYIHPLNEEIDTSTLSTEAKSIVANIEGKTDFDKGSKGSDSAPATKAKTDYSNDIAQSLGSFIAWLNKTGIYDKNSSESRAALNEARAASGSNAAIQEAEEAQRFTSEFRVNGARIEIITNVWAACDISAQKDYYLVQTTLVCNNDELGYSNDWDKNKCVGPYFDTAWLESSITKNNQTILWEKCSPHNQYGSTSTTTSSGFSIGGNIGFSGKGPSAGISAGYSWSKSKSSSIPDIEIEGKKTNDNHVWWKFNTTDIDPEVGFFSTSCDGAKKIQYIQSVFNTYSLYEIPSSYYYKNDKENLVVELTHWVDYRYAYMHGWWDWLTLYWRYNRYTESRRFDYFPIKPANAYNNYIMNVVYPEGTSNSDMAYFDSVFKNMIPDWATTVKYYGYSGKIDKVAKAYFAQTKKQIQNVESDLRNRNLKGKCKFYIKNVDTAEEIDKLEIVF